jgi:hypothetical protein
MKLLVVWRRLDNRSFAVLLLCFWAWSANAAALMDGIRAEETANKPYHLPFGSAVEQPRFAINSDGSVSWNNARFDRPHENMVTRRTRQAHPLRLDFDLPRNESARRWVEEECSSILHTEWDHAGIRYTQTTLMIHMASEKGDSLAGQDGDIDVLFVRLAGRNLTNVYTNAHVMLSLTEDNRSVPLIVRDGLLQARQASGKEIVSGIVDCPVDSELVDGRSVRYSASIPPGNDGCMFVKILFAPVETPKELERVRELDFEHEFRRVKRLKP